jgi:hypothetical protein
MIFLAENWNLAAYNCAYYVAYSLRGDRLGSMSETGIIRDYPIVIDLRYNVQYVARVSILIPKVFSPFILFMDVRSTAYLV